MVELDCAGFTILCLPVHSSGHSAEKGIQVLLSRDQCWSIEELSSFALADSSGFHLGLGLVIVPLFMFTDYDWYRLRSISVSIFWNVCQGFCFVSDSTCSFRCLHLILRAFIALRSLFFSFRHHRVLRNFKVFAFLGLWSAQYLPSQ
jgi:hypothetical protein